jgi:putative FmdB family regulatory protein
MPTYEYACDHCEHRFELFQQMTDPVKRKCPACGRLALRRLVGAGAGVIFRGNGFYQTDYRSDSYRKAAEAEKKSADGGGEKKKKKDPKPAASTGGKKKSAAQSTSPAAAG